MANGATAWTDVLVGLVIVAVGVFLVKILYTWYIFRKSIQKELYSNFIEYYFKKKSIAKLSTSVYFKNSFGKHRIIYQLVKNKNAEKPLAYILIVLTSGIYVLSVKSEKGKITAKTSGDFKNVFYDKKAKKEKNVLVPSPIAEINQFGLKLDSVFGISEETEDFIVYPDNTDIEIQGQLRDKLYIVNRKKLYSNIQEKHEKNTGKLTSEQIDAIYTKMTSVAK